MAETRSRTVFTEPEVRQAVIQSLRQAAEEAGSVTNDNQHDILARGFEIISTYTFLVELPEPKRVRVKKEVVIDGRTHTIDTDEYIHRKEVKYPWFFRRGYAWGAYKRMADFSELPERNPICDMSMSNKDTDRPLMAEEFIWHGSPDTVPYNYIEGQEQGSDGKWVYFQKKSFVADILGLTSCVLNELLVRELRTARAYRNPHIQEKIKSALSSPDLVEAAKDTAKSMGLDPEAAYEDILSNEAILQALGQRKVRLTFSDVSSISESYIREVLLHTTDVFVLTNHWRDSDGEHCSFAKAYALYDFFSKEAVDALIYAVRKFGWRRCWDLKGFDKEPGLIGAVLRSHKDIVSYVLWGYPDWKHWKEFTVTPEIGGLWSDEGE